MAPPFTRPLHPCEHCGRATRNAKYCGHPCFHEADAQRSLEAFWDRVAKGPGCWEWQGFRHDRGYGVITIRRHKQYAHRVAWELTNGPIPKAMVVMHQCDNPPCVRPDHLRLGTPADNSFDMKAKGRAWGNPMHGSQIPSAKLDEAKVAEIRKRRANRERIVDLAREYGVTVSAIDAVVHRRRWTKVA